MKKNIILKTILGVALSTLLYSCDDRIELSPEGSLTGDVVFSSQFAAQGAVTGLYAQARNVEMLNGNNNMFQGLMADELEWTGSFPTILDVFTYQTNATNTSTRGFWREGYQMILQANFILKYVPLMDEAIAPQDFKDNLIGQAKFMRAIAYFQMVNLYAQPYQVNNGGELGLPIITEPYDDNADIADFRVPRSTVSDVHNLILQDLTDAIDLLEVSNDNTIASKGSAQALKARLHLYRGEFSDAATLANEVITSGTYALATGFSFWDTLVNENIYTIANNATDGAFGTTGISSFALPSPVGRGDAFLSQDLLDAFALEPGDLRLSENSITGLNTDDVTKTFSNKVSSPNGDTKIPVIRITEMYYIRAEANLREGTNIGDTPLNDINALRNRADLPDLATVTVDDILNERRKEFFLEGHRRMDLLRNSRDLRPAGNPQAALAAFGADKTIFPIPTREIENNPSLVGQQNPGY